MWKERRILPVLMLMPNKSYLGLQSGKLSLMSYADKLNNHKLGKLVLECLRKGTEKGT